MVGFPVNSSISNSSSNSGSNSGSKSRQRLIKIVLFAVVSFGLYTLILQNIKPRVTKFQNQWIANYSRAEQYIYADDPPGIVIVGSSLSARLQQEHFENDVYNLSFSSGSGLVGLDIVKRSGVIPDVIYIETNTLDKPSDREMVDNLFTPVVKDVRSWFLSLQYTYQPINLFLSVLQGAKGGSHAAKLRNSKFSESRVARGLSIQLEENSSDETITDSSELKELQNSVNYFVESGAEVRFFQMPVHEQLFATKRYTTRKSVLTKMFPDTRFYWQNPDVARKYQTGDSAHLIYSSAYEFSVHFDKVISHP